MKSNKTSFVEINRNKKPIVLFGAGNIAKKTIRKIGKSNISFIVDNSTDLQGTKFDDLNIYSPEKITSGHYVIICSTAISSIAEQVRNYGLLENEGFVISPILNDLMAITELEELSVKVHFTSGTVPHGNSGYGGGLYKCEVNDGEINLEKIYSGACYGLIKQEETLIFVDSDNGLVRYEKGQLHSLCKLPKGSRAHGISFNESNDKYYVTCSYLDSVLELDGNFNVIREFPLSCKRRITEEPMHHCNDNLAMGNSLFVSMFSSTGNWKNDVFDGCIAEFNIETGERLQNIKDGLYMPHNLKEFDGAIHVLDSLPGHLLFNNLSIQGTFPGFTRGLDYNAGLYYIGQSKNRNYSKTLGLSNNISIDCGVIVFNPLMKVSRFIQFPHAIGEIHSIVV